MHNVSELLRSSHTIAVVGLSSKRYRPSYGVAEYMQNGSIGRRIDVEVRVFDDRLEFRYRIPRSTALDEILIEELELGVR